MPARIIRNKYAFIFKFWFPVFLCMAAIFFVSSVPGDDIPGLFPLQDIVFHFLIYMALGLLFSRAAKNSWNIRPLKVIILSLAFGILYAVSDEAHQLFVPNRNAALFDVWIDLAGNFTGGIRAFQGIF
jgi:VanZ family protein